MLHVTTPLSAPEESAIARTIECALTVHRELGPGFRESIYHRALRLELEAQGVRFESEKRIDVQFKQWTIPGQTVDLVVEGLIVVELKVVPRLRRLHEHQLRSYLKTMNLRGGLLMNFSGAVLKGNIKRVLRTPLAG